jgi:hypothetical protein
VVVGGGGVVYPSLFSSQIYSRFVLQTSTTQNPEGLMIAQRPAPWSSRFVSVKMLKSYHLIFFRMRRQLTWFIDSPMCVSHLFSIEPLKSRCIFVISKAYTKGARVFAQICREHSLLIPWDEEKISRQSQKYIKNFLTHYWWKLNVHFFQYNLFLLIPG